MKIHRAIFIFILVLVSCINKNIPLEPIKKSAFVNVKKNIIIQLVENTLKIAKTHTDRKLFIKDVNTINKVLVEHYIFIIDENFHLIAHKDAKLVNLDTKIIFDEKSRKSLAENFSEALKNNDTAWTNYFWKKNDGTLGKKLSYLARYKNYIIGCGYFK